jgi:hypothetical protein
VLVIRILLRLVLKRLQLLKVINRLLIPFQAFQPGLDYIITFLFPETLDEKDEKRVVVEDIRCYTLTLST